MNIRLKCEEGKTCTDPSVAQAIHDLKTEQNSLKLALDANTQLTQSIKDVIDSVHGFFNFCAKAGRFGVKMAKLGTVISVALVSVYHAIDAVASHNVGDFFKGLKK